MTKNIKFIQGIAAGKDLKELEGTLVQLQDWQPMIVLVENKTLRTSPVKSIRENFSEKIVYVKTMSGSLYVFQEV